MNRNLQFAPRLNPMLQNGLARILDRAFFGIENADEATAKIDMITLHHYRMADQTTCDKYLTDVYYEMYGMGYDPCWGCMFNDNDVAIYELYVEHKPTGIVVHKTPNQFDMMYIGLRDI